MKARYKCNYCGGLSRKKHGECKYCGAIDAFSLIEDEEDEEDEDDEDDNEEEENIDAQTEDESEEEDEFEENESVTVGSKISSSLFLIITGVALLGLPYICRAALPDVLELEPFSTIFSVLNFLDVFMVVWGTIKLVCAFMFEE